MLTRIEIDGFKSFADFSLDIPPFLAIVGPNASGKSNLFDAIQFLRSLAGDTAVRAFANARGEMRELFRRAGDGAAVDTMRLAVEVLVEPVVVDRFGKTVQVPHTRLRYEVTLATWVDDGVTYPYVARESATPILRGEDRWVAQHGASEAFRSTYLRYGHRAPLLETTQGSDGEPLFVLVEEAAGNRTREIPTEGAEATVLSTLITAATDYPTLYALRREMQSWLFLHLDPVSLRLPSPGGLLNEGLAPDGGNLAAVLRRIERQSADEAGSMLEEITADLTRIVRGVVDVEVAEDAARGQWEVYLRMRDEGRVSARVTSDGTLRVLALLAALYDPSGSGLVCFEEPENGIYPQKLRDLLRRLRHLVVDPAAEDVGGPLTQLLVTSHSPVLLRELPADQLVVFDWVTRVVAAKRENSRVTRARRIRAAQPDPVPLEEIGGYVTESERAAMVGLDQAQELLA